MNILLACLQRYFTTKAPADLNFPLARPPHRSNNASLRPLKVEVRYLSSRRFAVLGDVVDHVATRAWRELVLFEQEVLGWRNTQSSTRLVEKDVSASRRLKLEIERTNLFEDRRVRSAGVV
jgi:hypothetical protein